MIKKITNLYIFSICVNSTDAGFDRKPRFRSLTNIVFFC